MVLGQNHYDTRFQEKNPRDMKENMRNENEKNAISVNFKSIKISQNKNQSFFNLYFLFYFSTIIIKINIKKKNDLQYF